MRTVGYVKTGWAENPIDDVLAEVATYAAWAAKANDPLMGVDGIFFDESPSEGDETTRTWLETAVKGVKGADGFGSDKTVGTCLMRRVVVSPC